MEERKTIRTENKFFQTRSLEKQAREANSHDTSIYSYSKSSFLAEESDDDYNLEMDLQKIMNESKNKNIENYPKALKALANKVYNIKQKNISKDTTNKKSCSNWINKKTGKPCIKNIPLERHLVNQNNNTTQSNKILTTFI